MPKIAVMIDRWKLPHFEKAFAKAGYSYAIDTVHNAPALRLSFWGEVEEADKVIRAAQAAAANSLH